MNYLSNYIQEAQADTMRKHGAFFAFSQQQFNDQKVDGVTYTTGPSGLLCPTANMNDLVKGLALVHRAGIAADLAENGKLAIIQRELANHECQITMDYSDALEALAGYDITEAEVRTAFSAYMDYCREHDLF